MATRGQGFFKIKFLPYGSGVILALFVFLWRILYGKPSFQAISQKNQNIKARCRACGYTSQIDMRHKLTTFILKNPPDMVSLSLTSLQLVNSYSTLFPSDALCTIIYECCSHLLLLVYLPNHCHLSVISCHSLLWNMGLKMYASTWYTCRTSCFVIHCYLLRNNVNQYEWLKFQFSTLFCYSKQSPIKNITAPGKRQKGQEPLSEIMGRVFYRPF